MQSFFNLETEVTHRRSEWERAVAAAERQAQVRPQTGQMRWSHLPQRVLASLHAVATRRLPVPAWNPAGVTRASTRVGGHATGM